MRLWDWPVVSFAVLVGSLGAGTMVTGGQLATTPASLPRQIVYLDKSPGFYLKKEDGENRGLLARELFRQAVLLAAREELGLVTRDAWLGDAIPGEGPSQPFEIVTLRKEPLVLELQRGFGSRKRQVGTVELPQYSEKEYYCRLFVAAERFSRTSFVESLRKDCGEGQPHPWKPDLTLPGDVEDSLREMSFLPQFKAIRRVHDFVATQGESPASLSALVRGYANLGILTEFHWHPAHKVFKARAILYAQRWLWRQPDSAPALWHRAYALTLTGLHVDAMADLESAERIWRKSPQEAWQESAEKGGGTNAEKDAPQPPGWVAVLHACCRYDIDKLAAELNHAEHGQLAALLQYHTVEQSGSKPWALKTGLAMLRRVPECYRIHDGTAKFASMSLTQAGFQPASRILGRTLYGYVREMPGIPESVRQHARRPLNIGRMPSIVVDGARGNPWHEFAVRARLIAALREASQPWASSASQPRSLREAPHAGARSGDKPGLPADGGEPSWAALAQLIHDVSFWHVWRQADFLRDSLDASADDFLVLAAPLVAAHPLRLLVEQFVWDAAKHRNLVARAAKVKPDGLEGHAFPLIYNLYAVDDAAARQICKSFYDHADPLVRDAIVIYRMTGQNREWFAEHAKRLSALSPHSPMPKSILLDTRRASKEQATEWEKLAPKYPGLAHSLAAHYARGRQWDKAVPFCQMAIQATGDRDLQEFLARLYLSQGDENRWLKTMEAAIRMPDQGLGRASLCSKVAKHFMRKKEWQRALPYAQAAAQSYSAWGLDCAACCCEGLQQWKIAEAYTRAQSERYRTSSTSWYYFCRRTGKGNLQAARELAVRYLDDPSAQEDGGVASDRLLFQLLEKDWDKALANYRQRLEALPDAYVGLWVATLADQLDDAKTRDAALERIRSKGSTLVRQDTGKPPKELIQVAVWLERDLAQGGQGALDFKAVEELRRSMANDRRTRANADVFLARYLQTHGKRELAIHYWKQVMGLTAMSCFQRCIAGAALSDLGVKPEEYKALLSPSEADEEHSSNANKGNEKPGGQPADKSEAEPDEDDR